MEDPHHYHYNNPNRPGRSPADQAHAESKFIRAFLAPAASLGSISISVTANLRPRISPSDDPHQLVAP